MPAWNSVELESFVIDLDCRALLVADPERANARLKER